MIAKWLSLLLLLSYPVAVHLAPPVGVAILMALLLLMVWTQWRSKQGGGLRLGALVLGFSLFLAMYPGRGELILYLPPVLINLLLLWFFARTLFLPHRPLITLFAEQFHQVEAGPALAAYTRGVTVLWSWLFALMAVESVVLAIWASRETWSLFTNFFNYLLILLVFLVEHRIRIRRLPELEHPGFFGFLLALRHFDPRTLLKS